MISVLIPSYNVEKYIDEALVSILNQSYHELEVVIVDDCSTDRTYEICQKYARNDKRIKLFRNKENKGIARTLNFALSQASGEYVVRMDADDISVENRIERMHQFLLDNSHVDIVGSATITINEEGKELGIYTPLEYHADLIKTVNFSSPLLHIWMCKKSVYERVGTYRFPPVEDYDFMLRCINSGIIIHNLMEPLYKVRIRNGNTADSYGFRQLKAFESASKAYRENKLHELIIDLQPSPCSEWLYQISRNIYFSGVASIRSGGRVIGLLMLMLSALVSPYQLRYMYRRLRFQLYKWRKSH
ncbi:glycosyltransferase family A protein [Zobellella aerophila]|uniref:Glycosyltransferase 2-like domain-containing protein n=1 Tax=Zobellella aerophila TaxID=870480 RepID=A0ABP6VIS3_9GAMM